MARRRQNRARALSALASLLAFLSRGIDDVATGLARLGSPCAGVGKSSSSSRPTARSCPARAADHRSRSTAAALRSESTGRTVAAAVSKLLAGSQVHVVLAPARFVFRPLELPRAAGAFLDGVVRSQIDRLSPWSASAAVFGWSAPVDIGSDKIALTVAAAARTQVDQIAAGAHREQSGLRRDVDPPGAKRENR